MWLKRTILPLAVAALALTAPQAGHGQGRLSAEAFRLLPLRIHLLRAKRAPDLHCNLTEADARRVLGKVNGVWKQAGIQFYLESLLTEEAANQELYAGLARNRMEAHLRLIRPRASLSSQVFHLYFVGRMRPNGIALESSHELLFVKDTAELNPVPGGIDEPLPRVTAHEIGHALSLPHRQDTSNLMASGTTGTSLNEAEIESARKAAEAFPWRLKPAEALARADQCRTDRPMEAAGLYGALANLPAGPVADAARRGLAELAAGGKAKPGG